MKRIATVLLSSALVLAGASPVLAKPSKPAPAPGCTTVKSVTTCTTVSEVSSTGPVVTSYVDPGFYRIVGQSQRTTTVTTTTVTTTTRKLPPVVEVTSVESSVVTPVRCYFVSFSLDLIEERPFSLCADLGLFTA